MLAKLERLEILVQIENLDSKDKVIIVAEIGNNHEGSFSLAKKLIDEAAQAGVDAVKFQTFQTKTFVAPTQKERFQDKKQRKTYVLVPNSFGYYNLVTSRKKK